MRRARAVGILSGGLDSILAAELLRRMGVEVIGVHFLIGFCGDVRQQLDELSSEEWKERARPPGDFVAGTRSLWPGGMPVEVIDVAESFTSVLLDPDYGYGGNFNPCVDCKIFMLRKAKEIMEQRGADFVFSGEVLGQRPKSQRRDSMNAIERDAGLRGRLLRPLSARLMKPTIAEEEGLIDRSLLKDFSGRTRKPQMALAEEYGISEYPSPAGGCLLTDPGYAARLRDFVEHPTINGVLDNSLRLLCSVGRHFRLSSTLKVIVARNHPENIILNRLAAGWGVMEATNVAGPVCMLMGKSELEEETKRLAAGLCIRYGKGRRDPGAVVVGLRGGDREELLGPGLSLPDEEKIASWRI